MWRTRLREQAWAFYRDQAGSYLTSAGLCGANPDGAQCINVPLTWLEHWRLSAPCGDASTWDGASIERHEWVRGSTGLVLHAGDILVFNPAIVGVAGHVSLVLNAAHGRLVSCDQNWPLGAPVGKVEHSRSDLSGVQRRVRL